MCLIDLVDITRCGADADYYVDSLPGVSTELIENISNLSDFNDYFINIKKTAIAKFYNDVTNELKKTNRVNFNEVKYQTPRLRKTYNETNYNTPNKNKGIYVKIVNSKYAGLRFKNIYIFSKTIFTGAIIKIVDLNDNTVLFTTTVDLVVGLNTISNILIDNSKDLLMKYGAIEIALIVEGAIETIETRKDYYAFEELCSCNYSQETINYIAPCEINNTLPINYQNLSIGSRGNGITLDCQIICSIESYICQNLEIFVRSYMYLLAYFVLKYKLSSSLNQRKMNIFTYGNMELTETIMKDYENEYKIALRTAIESVILESDYCFNCDDNLDTFSTFMNI